MLNKEEIFERLVYNSIRYEEEPPCLSFGVECPHRSTQANKYGDYNCDCNCDYDECYKNLKKVLTNTK